MKQGALILSLLTTFAMNTACSDTSEKVDYKQKYIELLEKENNRLSGQQVNETTESTVENVSDDTNAETITSSQGHWVTHYSQWQATTIDSRLPDSLTDEYVSSVIDEMRKIWKKDSVVTSKSWETMGLDARSLQELIDNWTMKIISIEEVPAK